MINPMINPVFSHPSLNKLLQQFDESQVGRIATDFAQIGDRYSPVQYQREFDRFTNPDHRVEEQEKSGLWDVASAAGILDNFTARAIFNLDRYATGALGLYGNETISNDFSADKWFAAPENRQYLQGLPGSQGQNIVQNWIRGDYNDLTNVSQFFASVGYDLTEHEYRDIQANADGVTSLVGGLWGAGADPLGMLGGAALVNLGGKAVVAFDLASQAATAAKLSALGVRISKTDSVATAAGKAMLAGTAYSTVTEAGLQALEKDRTWEHSAENMAGNVVFNSVLAGGLGMLAGRNLVKGTTHFQVEAREPVASLADLDAHVGRVMKEKIDATLGNLQVAEPAKTTPLLTDGGPPGPNTDVPISGRDLLANYGRKLNSPETAQAKAAAVAPDNGVDLIGAMASKVQEVVKGDVAPDEFTKLIDEILSARKEIADAKAKAQLGSKAKAPAAESPDPLAADPTAGDGAAFTSEKKGSDGGDGTGGGGAVDVPDGAGGRTMGYEDYFPDIGVDKARMNSILELTDKYLNNRILGHNVTVNAAQFTTNPQLAMFYQKMFRSIFPSKAATQGLVQGAAPFEAVSGMMRKKGLSVQHDLSDSFRQFIRTTDPGLYTRVITDERIGRELWSALPGAKDLLSKEKAWYEFLDVLRVARATALEQTGDFHLFYKDMTPENIDAFRKALVGSPFNPDAPPMELALFFKNEAVKNIFGGEYLKDLGERLGYQALDAAPAIARKKLEETLMGVLDKDLGKVGNIRERLRPTTEKIARDPKLETMRKDYSLSQTSIGLPDDMSVSEFLAFWNAHKGVGTGPADTQQTMLRYFLDHFKSISKDDLLNPTQATVNRLRNTFYNDMGGFVGKNNLLDVLAIKRADGSPLVKLDARRTIGLHVRAMEQLELAYTLRDYLAEATQWDGRLLEKMRVNATSESPVTMLDTFQELKLNKALRGDIDPKTGHPFEPDSGFFRELKDWNDKALSTIEGNIKDTAVEYTSDRHGNPLDDQTSLPIREREKVLTAKVFQSLRSRLDMATQLSTPESQLIKRNISAFTRNLFLTGQGRTNLQDLGQAIAAVAASPFKGDWHAAWQGFAADLRGAKLQGKDLGPLIDNIEFTAAELREVLLNRTSQGEFDPVLDEKLDSFTKGQKLAAFQDRTAGSVIQTLSMGQAVMETSKSVALFSSLHQVTSKDGLIIKMANALGDIDEGMSVANAFAKHAVPEYYGQQALKYLNAEDIKTVAELIRNDVHREISTPRRFFLDSFIGEKKIKVLDLPEGATSQQRSAMEAVGMLVNDLATREKLSMPGWGDDLLGPNSTSKAILTFWMRPNIAIFNRAFLAQGNKALGARFAVYGSMMTLAGLIDIAKAYSNGEEAMNAKLAELDTDFLGWSAKRAGWAGATGWAGEKGINVALGLINPKPGENASDVLLRQLTPAPFGALGTAAQAGSGVLKAAAGKATQQDADAIWKVMSASGLANDTLAFRLMGRFGRQIGVYGEDSNSVDIQKFWYDQLGVPSDKRK